MTLVRWTDADIASLMVTVEAHRKGAECVAATVVDSRQYLEQCKLRLAGIKSHDEPFVSNVSRLDEALSLLEADPAASRAASAALTGWAALSIDDAGVPSDSMARGGYLRRSDDLLESLLDPQDLAKLREWLDRPLFGRLRWTKGDYLVCGACVVVGLALELLNLAWRANSPIDRNGDLRKWFDARLHHHAPNSPMDYQGPGFGGDLHRVRSPGHDLTRFLNAVEQTAAGEFSGTRWSDGTPRQILSGVNEWGTPYPQMDWLAAFTNVVIHLFGDFFSAHSLPLPLTSVVYEYSGREFRKFVHDLYRGGANLRQLAAGGTQVLLAWLAIEVWVWMQHGTDGRVSDPVRLKRYEMRSAVTGLLCGANIAGCVLFENPFLMNVPVLLASVDSAAHLVQLRTKQGSQVWKASRNLQDVLDEWDALARDVSSVSRVERFGSD